MQTDIYTIQIAFAPLWGSGTTILRELVYDTSSGSKVLTYALYYGYDEAGAISHVTVAEIVVAITDSNETSEHKTACGMAAGGFAYGGENE